MAEWLDSLGVPDDLKTAPVFGKYQNLESALRGLKEASSLLGSSIRIPGPDAGAEVWEEYYGKLAAKDKALVRLPREGDAASEKAFKRALGIPEDPSEYTAPEGFESKIPEEGMRGALELSKELGLTKTQHRKLLQALNGQVEGMTAKQQEAREREQAEWQRLQGQAAEAVMGDIQTLVEKFQAEGHPIPPELLEQLPVRMLFANLAKTLRGGGPQVHLMPRGNEAVTPGEARERLREIRERLLKHGLDKDERKDLLDKLVRYQQAATAA